MIVQDVLYKIIRSHRLEPMVNYLKREHPGFWKKGKELLYAQKNFPQKTEGNQKETKPACTGYVPDFVKRVEAQMEMYQKLASRNEDV